MIEWSIYREPWIYRVSTPDWWLFRWLMPKRGFLRVQRATPLQEEYMRAWNKRR